MSKESTKAAFARATGHLLLNLSPEQEASLTAYRKSEERIRMEQQSEVHEGMPLEATFDFEIAKPKPRLSRYTGLPFTDTESY